MSSNKVQEEGSLIRATAPYAVTSNQGVLVGALFGVVESVPFGQTTAAIGESLVIDTKGVWDLTKATGGSNAFAFGDRVFWDNTARVVTPVSAGNTEIGIAVAAALAAATTARVRLGVIEPQLLANLVFTAFPNGHVASQVFFIAPAPMQILSVQEVHSTLGTDAGAVTGSVEKLTGTQASGAGVTVLSATANLKGANNTVQTPALSATAANLLLATGDRVGFVLSGTATSVAGVVVSVLARYL
jgi:predicted RecA/RadA family phage recombinase